MVTETHGAAVANDQPPPAVAVRGTAATLGGQLIRFVVQTASLGVLARLLSPSDYGLVAMVTTIVGIAAVIGDFGLSLAAVQAKVLSREQKSNLFWLNALIGVALAALVYALAGPIASYYHRETLANIVRVLSVTFAINGFTTQFKAELTRALRFVKLSVVDVLAQAIALVVALAAALAHVGYWALVAQQLTVAGVTLISAAMFARWWPSWPRRGSHLRGLLSFGANTAGVQAISYVSSNVDNLLVGRYWGVIPLGVYSRAYNLFELPLQQLAAPLTRVVLPILSRVDDDERYVAYLARAQLMLSYGLIGTFAAAASVAQPLIAIVLGPQWHGAAVIFQVLALGGVFQALGYMYYWIFTSRGKVGIQLRYSLTGRVLMIGFIFVGVQFSTLGAAAGAAAGLFVMWLLYSFLGVRRAGINVGPINRDAIRVIILLAAMFGCSQLVYWTVTTGWSVWLALLFGLLIDAAVIAIAAVVLPVIRRDLTAVWSTVALVAGPRVGSTRFRRHSSRFIENQDAQPMPVAMLVERAEAVGGTEAGL